MSVQDKGAKQGPRKLLALDGGGIRGVMTLEILRRDRVAAAGEARARATTFVLADYFDYIAGTSTGAIIATCLSLGMRVDDIREFYIDSGPAMFDKNEPAEALPHATSSRTRSSRRSCRTSSPGRRASRRRRSAATRCTRC